MWPWVSTPRTRFVQIFPTTASVSFSHGIGPADPIALATNDAGAIVAVNLLEATTVAPVEAGAAVNPTGQVKALSGISVSTKGVVATYSDQLLFYVPPAGSDAKIILLGYSQGLITATEIGWTNAPLSGANLRGAVDLSSLVRPPATHAAPAPSGGVIRQASDATFTEVLDLSSTVPVVCGVHRPGHPVVPRATGSSSTRGAWRS